MCGHWHGIWSRTGVVAFTAFRSLPHNVLADPSEADRLVDPLEGVDGDVGGVGNGGGGAADGADGALFFLLVWCGRAGLANV